MKDRSKSRTFQPRELAMKKTWLEPFFTLLLELEHI